MILNTQAVLKDSNVHALLKSNIDLYAVLCIPYKLDCYVMPYNKLLRDFVMHFFWSLHH